MKTSHFLYFLFATLLFSCGQNKQEEFFAEYEQTNPDYQTYQTSNYQDINSDKNKAESFNYDQQQVIRQEKPTTFTNGGLKMYKIMDPKKGIVFGTIPIPSNWQVKQKNAEGILFEGPNGLKTYYENSAVFAYFNDTSQNQFAQQNGQTVKPVKNLQQIINQEFIPFAQKNGVRLVNQFKLPQLEQTDRQNDSYIYKSSPEQKQYQYVATEWEGPNGVKTLAIIRYYVTQFAVGGLNWGYTVNSLDVSAQGYEQAKKAYINALVNLKMNPKWVQQNNQYYAQMTQKGNRDHQYRMDQIKQFGINNTKAYNARSAASDAGHSAYIDGIYDRSNMTDNSGNQYQVEGYNNNTWVNQGTDQYMTTDDYNYNPNTDNTINNGNWEQLQYSDDGGNY